MKNVIDYSFLFDFFRNAYADLSYKKPLGKAKMPLRYFFELTYRCNLKCPYCYVGQNRKIEELSLDDWIKIISQIPPYSFVTLVGGEPLIREDFKEILFKCSKRTFGKLNVVTNGILMNDDIIDSFVKSKMMLLSVSLDGWGKNHDKNRATEGIFEKIKSNLDNLNDRKKRPMVDIKTIVLKDNLDDLLKLYEYCTRSGFEFFSVSFLRNNDLKQNSILRENFGPEFYETNYPIEQYFNLDEFEKIFKEINKIRKHSKTKIRFSPKFEDSDFDFELSKIRDFFTNKKNALPRDIYEPCKFPYSNMIINPKGDVYPCLSLKIGNVKDKKLIDVYNEAKFKCFRNNLKYSKVFTSCQMCCELKVKNHIGDKT